MSAVRENLEFVEIRRRIHALMQGDPRDPQQQQRIDELLNKYHHLHQSNPTTAPPLQPLQPNQSIPIDQPLVITLKDGKDKLLRTRETKLVCNADPASVEGACLRLLRKENITIDITHFRFGWIGRERKANGTMTERLKKSAASIYDYDTMKHVIDWESLHHFTLTQATSPPTVIPSKSSSSKDRNKRDYAQKNMALIEADHILRKHLHHNNYRRLTKNRHLWANWKYHLGIDPKEEWSDKLKKEILDSLDKSDGTYQNLQVAIQPKPAPNNNINNNNNNNNNNMMSQMVSMMMMSSMQQQQKRDEMVEEMREWQKQNKQQQQQWQQWQKQQEQQQQQWQQQWQQQQQQQPKLLSLQPPPIMPEHLAPIFEPAKPAPFKAPKMSYNGQHKSSSSVSSIRSDPYYNRSLQKDVKKPGITLPNLSNSNNNNSNNSNNSKNSNLWG